MSIVIVMIVLFFLFQFSQIYKDSSSDYKVNMYASEKEVLRLDKQPAGSDYLLDCDVLYVGENPSSLYGAVTEWCKYQKMVLHQTLAEDVPSDLSQEIQQSGVVKMPDLVVIDGSQLDTVGDEIFARFISMANAGIHIVVADLPIDHPIVDKPSFNQLTGITGVQSSQTSVQGMELYQGLLIGGDRVFRLSRGDENYYQDLELTFPWYLLGGGTQKYMVGLLDRREVNPTLFPPVIWGNNSFPGKVYVVVGDYLDGHTGIGFLSAFMYESSDYYFYPVVNAQTVSLGDFSGLSGENDAVISQLYSRSSEATMRDIIWPGLITVSQKNDLLLSSFMQTQYDYSAGLSADKDALIFYLKQFREMLTEAGRSLEIADDVSIDTKVNMDDGFYSSSSPQYQYKAYYRNKVDDSLREEIAAYMEERGGSTLVTGPGSDGDLVAYIGDHITSQKAYINIKDYSFRRDLQQLSLLSGMGYSSLLLDLRPVMWAEDALDVENHWENVLRDVAGNLKQHYAENTVIDRLTVSGADERIRGFLNESWQCQRDGNNIYLHVEDFEGGGYFILRLHGESIMNISGAASIELEPGAFLIQMRSQDAEVHLGVASNVYSFWN